jgi:hypothetical protein
VGRDIGKLGMMHAPGAGAMFVVGVGMQLGSVEKCKVIGVCEEWSASEGGQV